MSVIIIAEAGVNHNGSLDLAKKMIDVAASAGVDYVKFQTFITELNITKNAEKAEYQKNNDGVEDSQFEMVKKLELSFDNFIELYDYCNNKGVGFLSTGFDGPSVDFLEDKIEFYKIPSGEITNKPFLNLIASKKKKIIMSTGMANIVEINDALSVLVSGGVPKDDITILHCNTEYPTPMKDVNLLAMNHIKSALEVEVGYSDHTLGIEVPIAAVALGAKVIEKHFTLDRTLPGPDHAASLEPKELVEMVKAIRNVEFAISGSGNKEASASEIKNKEIARKSIVASRIIHSGEIFSRDNLAVKRPGTGISPMKWDDVIGKTAVRNFEKDEIIEL